MTINQIVVDSRAAAKGKCFPAPYSSQGDICSSSLQLAELIVESLVLSSIFIFIFLKQNLQTFSGNRPSLSLLLPSLNAYNIGQV